MKKENKAQAKIKKQEAKRKAVSKERLFLGLGIGIPALIFVVIILSTIIDFKAVFNGTYNTSRFFSKYLTEEGTLADGKIAEYTNVGDYTDFTIPYSEIKADDNEIVDKIKASLADYEVLSKDEAIVKDGDNINLDYIGYLGNEKEEIFENTNGKGTTLLIGSNKYIDGFEDAVIGHGVGETFDIEVSFPEDYDNEKLRGKDAIFEVTVNGIYISPELTDEFVKEKLSAYAETAAEYREYIAGEIEKANKAAYVKEYISKNGEVLEYPEDYIAHNEKISFYLYESEYNYYRQYYGASSTYNSIYDYYQMSEKEYDAYIKAQAKADAHFYMKIEAIYTQLGLSLTEEQILKFWQGQGVNETYDNLIKFYGEGYTKRLAMSEAVINYLVENAVIAA